MSNTGQIDSDVKSPGEIKVSLLSMRYHSSDQNTIDVCTETVRLIIDQQLRLASFEKELNDYKVASCAYANQLCKIKDVVSGFNNGIQILTCDGMVHLTLSEYNSLVQAINATE